jgi:hypothetical protein
VPAKTFQNLTHVVKQTYQFCIGRVVYRYLHHNLKQINMTISEYAKRSTLEKAVILREQAVYLDQYLDDGKTVFVYYFNGFFIEAITSVGVIVDVIPYARDYNFSKHKLNGILNRNSRIAA